MKLEEFIALYPKVPIEIHYVERGDEKNRAFGFYVMFTANYFTTDSDRLCEHTNNDYRKVFAETLEDALDRLNDVVGDSLRSRSESWDKEAKEARARLEDWLAKRGDK